MGTSSAVVEIIYRARNLADAATDDLKAGLNSVASTAATTAGRVAGAFASLGSKLANGIGNAVETLSSGGGIDQALAGLGIYMAGQLAEEMAGHLLERIATSGLVAALTAPLTAMGTAMGGILAAAIPIGMALLPVILVGALVAAVAFLIANPDITQKIIAFVGDLVGKIGQLIGEGLKILGDIIPKAFGAVWQLVVDGVGLYIKMLTTVWIDIPKALIGLGGDILRTIIGGLAGLPGKIWDIVTGAFRDLNITIGPFHITGQGVTVDLPKIDIPHFASGGVMTRTGLAVMNENGGEIVKLPGGSTVYPAGTGPGTTGNSTSGVFLEGITQRQLVDMVEQGLFFRLRRAGTSA